MSVSTSGGYDPAMYGSIPPIPLTEEGAAEGARDAAVEGGATVERGMPETAEDLSEAAATIAAINDPANEEAFEDLRGSEN